MAGGWPWCGPDERREAEADGAITRTIAQDVHEVALRLGERELTEDEIVDLMVAHPDLMERPIVEKGKRAILARPPERLREIL